MCENKEIMEENYIDELENLMEEKRILEEGLILGTKFKYKLDFDKDEVFEEMFRILNETQMMLSGFQKETDLDFIKLNSKIKRDQIRGVLEYIEKNRIGG